MSNFDFIWLFQAFFGIVTLSGALYVLISNNVLFAALGLLVSLLGIAGLYVLAGAEFLAGAQIMLYVGGILVIIIFGIMLSGKNQEIRVEKSNMKYFSILISIIVSFGLLCLMTVISKSQNSKSQPPSLFNIGKMMMTTHILALEIIGLILLITLIGATFIAKKND